MVGTLLAPQAAQAQAPVVLTSTPGAGKVTLEWTYSGGQAAYWSYRHKASVGGSWSAHNRIDGSSAGTRRHTVTGLTSGIEYQFIVYGHNSSGTVVGQSSSGDPSHLNARTTPLAFPPTLISDPDKSVTAGTGGTVVVCYNLLSVSYDGTTYLEKRQGRTAVPAHSALKDTTNGVSITEAPAVISAQVLGTGNVNFDPCATVGPGTHTVTWEWNGPDGAASKGTTSTTFTVAPHPSTVPAKPTEVRARSLNGGVALFWAVPGDNRITGWKYRRKAADDDNWGAWTTFLQVSTQYSGGSGTHGSTFGGLTNGTVYAFQIRATSANGDGAVSDTVAARPMAAPATVTATVAPAKPAKFRATGGNGQVTLRWGRPGGRQHHPLGVPAEERRRHVRQRLDPHRRVRLRQRPDDHGPEQRHGIHVPGPGGEQHRQTARFPTRYRQRRRARPSP